MINLVKTENLRQPNLLVNANFSYSIINQKGKTAYLSEVGTEYTIDMWIKRGKETGVELLDKSVKVSVISSGTYFNFNQPIYISKDNYAGKTLTFTIKVKSIKGVWRLAMCGNTNGVHLTSNIIDKSELYLDSAGIFSLTFNVPDDITKYSTVVAALSTHANYVSGNSTGGKVGDFIDIEFIKLEYGSLFTGMPVFNRTEEESICFKKYQNIGNVVVHRQAKMADTEYGATYVSGKGFIRPMAQQPILSCQKVCDTREAKELAGVNINTYSVTSKGITWVRLNKEFKDASVYLMNVTLDAYDY